MKLLIQESGQLVGHRIVEAHTFLRRLRGLMLTDSLAEGNGLHIRPCQGVHSFFMKYPIDVLHLSEDNIVIGLEQELRPGKIGANIRGTHSVVELPAGTIASAGICIGQTAMFTQ
ncbi:DUF192 domain-containing protein [Paenibacillus montanisoli]|uniref:DUF192 domain-containing protein n=1 Tax=Paenibacillus montanisoli TaxID=2081970 RepID=A0A328TW15_9BACL|nr:DUF192 domain-containing protein [Paenibacillus montanisoli]RAP73723.1 DUF192 domain-containing protein [Paenibacillus montanisoli]